eukprot:TRINITY_DN9975_c0_g1_i1.p1 TRINITY_DN9975_c0_g1~~TRINITY_DN9975_c0_g1_i1.p1  ORF type:complete len:250 (-),score=43.32 TRINITY_DN9975_c0_g1_i1:233-982(-)
MSSSYFPPITRGRGYNPPFRNQSYGSLPNRPPPPAALRALGFDISDDEDDDVDNQMVLRALEKQTQLLQNLSEAMKVERDTRSKSDYRALKSKLERMEQKIMLQELHLNNERYNNPMRQQARTDPFGFPMASSAPGFLPPINNGFGGYGGGGGGYGGPPAQPMGPPSNYAQGYPPPMSRGYGPPSYDDYGMRGSRRGPPPEYDDDFEDEPPPEEDEDFDEDEIDKLLEDDDEEDAKPKKKKKKKKGKKK